MQTTITSRENERVKYARHIAESASFRGCEGVFFAEGRRLCLDLAQSFAPVAVFVTQRCLESSELAPIMLKDAFVVSESVAQKLAGAKTPQGLFCLFETPRVQLTELHPEKGILICQQMQDPSNVGAVVRSAAGLGFGGVVLADGCADPFSPKALRASMGAVCRLPVASVENLASAVAYLKEKEKTVLYAAALLNALPLSQVKPSGPFALMIGNEGSGLTPEALALADQAVCIPMQNGMESLNAAAAAAVMMYALTAK